MAPAKLARGVQRDRVEVAMRNLAITILWTGILASSAYAQLSSDWIVPAVADTEGARGSYWRTDLSLHNPHAYELPVVVQLLPSGSENWEVPTMWITLYEYETLNLWDVLGPDLFASHGTGAMLVYADTDLDCDPVTDCSFLVSSRTYTLDPRGDGGEFGQTVPGVDVGGGVDWERYGYAAGILNDGSDFRCNFGAASWTSAWTTLWVDVQDADGSLLATHELEVPPFGHVQRRLPTPLVGGSLVFYLVEGPEDSRVFPYASMANQTTSDASYSPGIASVVGAVTDKAARSRDGRRVTPRAVRLQHEPDQGSLRSQKR
jgi:hypothetical protein